MNNTSQSPVLEFDLNVHQRTVNVTRTVILITMALTAYFGNTMTLVCLKTFPKQLKGTPFILLGNLAVADLLLAVGLTLEVLGNIFIFLEVNMTFCVAELVLIGISFATSGKLLIFVSVDRFCAIMFPMKHLANSQKTRYRRIHLAAVWTVSVSTLLIPFFISLRSSRVLESCQFDRLISEDMGIRASVFILLQFCINVILCVLIMWRLRTNSISRQKYESSMRKCGFLIKGYILYFVSWMPFVITSILITVSEDKEQYVYLREYTLVPGLFYSSMNWLIYGYTNDKLRAAFKNILLCRSKRGLISTSITYIEKSEKRLTKDDQEQQQQQQDLQSSDTH